MIEKNDDFYENLMILIGNIIMFAMLWYAVFILGHSGWWFAFLLIFHFHHRRDKKENEKDKD